MNLTSIEPDSALTRRQFLKNSSSALAGAALLGALPLGRSVHAADNDLLKIALAWISTEQN